MKETEGVEYPFERRPDPGAALEVARGIHWLRMPLPFTLDHINLWLLDDGDGWTIVDTGYALPEVRDLWGAIFSTVLAGRPVRRVLVTHFHPDHMGLAAWLTERHGVDLWTTQAEWLMAHLVHVGGAALDADARARFYRSHGASSEQLAALTERSGAYRKGVPELARTFRRLREGEEIRTGDGVWRVIVGTGHSPEHACLHNAERGVLVSGDQVLPRITSNVSVYPTEPLGDPLHLYLDSLEKFRGLDPSTLVLPSHGRPFRGLHARLDALRIHHRERLAVAHAACDRPRSAVDLVPVLFARALDAHQLFFAVGEALAHVNYLVGEGRLIGEREADGVFRYRRA